jgi:GT2 family glycosyltransferase
VPAQQRGIQTGGRTNVDQSQLSHRISCIVPTHGRPELLARALTSISNQTLLPTEIIVSDDLGELATEQVVRDRADDIDRRYLDSHIDSMGTAGSSRNLGAAVASGDLIAFLDDDDRWDPNYLQNMVAALDRTGADFVVSWGRLEIGDTIIEANWRIKPNQRFTDVLTVNPGFTGSNFVIRRSVFNKVSGFDASLRVYNDLDLFVRLLDAGATYAVVDQSLVTQVGDGEGHLSSRGKRRALGIRAYGAKWSSRLTLGDRRRLSRDVLVALNYRDRGAVSRAAILAGIAVTSSVADVRYSVRRRVHREPRNYS